MATAIIHDVEDGGESVAAAATAAGLTPRIAVSPADALRWVVEGPCDVLIVAATPRDEICDLVQAARDARSEITVIALSNGGDLDDVVAIVKAGADEVVDRPLEAARLAEALPDHRVRRKREHGRPRFVASSAPMLEIMARLRKVARVDSTVLLLGESGTGKEILARFLHENHPRRSGGPLVCVHCGAIPDTLLESELFGHVKGAFTGADRDRVGKFEQADGGTIFLDEIATMKPEAQVRLLRVLQERRVTRVGSVEPRVVDVRVVVASNQDLLRLVGEGEFRLDLYYRISTFPVAIPPLRARVSEIPRLVEAFAAASAERLGLASPPVFSEDALEALMVHPWPGNVRELENAVEYAGILAEGDETIDRRHLPPDIAAREGRPSPSIHSQVVLTEEGLSFRSAVTGLERDLILQSLRLADGNKARAAELLDLKRTTFLEKLRRLEEDGWIPSGRDAEPPPESAAD